MSLFRPTEKRSLSYQEVWGRGYDTNELRSVTIDRALRIPSVFAATMIIADTASSLPIHSFLDDGTRERRINAPSLIADPTLNGGVEDWVFQFMTSRLLAGNDYGLITEANAYGPTRVEWLHPDEVHPDDIRTSGGRTMWTWNGKPVPAGDLVHKPWYLLPGRTVGHSPIQALALDVETGLAVRQYGRDWFHNGGHPSSVLETDKDIRQGDAETIKKRFKLAARSREPVVIGGGVKYRQIQQSFGESHALDTNKAIATTVANIYGIDPEEIGGETGSSNTYANIEHRAIHFVTRTLRPHLVAFERFVSRMLPERQYIRFNADAIIRPDTLARYAAHEKALRAGFKNVDEVRELEHLEPVPGGEGKQFLWPPYSTVKAATTDQTAPVPPGGAGNGVNSNGNGVRPGQPAARP